MTDFPYEAGAMRRILAVLDQSTGWQGLVVPGFNVHPLAGQLQGHHAVTVSANWRITFRFEEGDAFEVDYIDYH